MLDTYAHKVLLLQAQYGYQHALLTGGVTHTAVFRCTIYNESIITTII